MTTTQLPRRPHVPSTCSPFRALTSTTSIERNTTEAIPRGTGIGTAIFVPGRKVGRILAKITTLVAWQGKVIDDDGSQLVNLVSPLRRRAVRANLYQVG